MPLLGRHKSSGNSSSSGQSVGSQGANSAASAGGGINQASASSHSRQVCESPLFGLRKQISLSGQSESLKGSKLDGKPTTATSNQQSISGNHHSSNNETISSQLNSIPQQITRQQIHYAFSIMDSNQDGLIDLRDLSQMLANLGVPIDEAILSHIMSSVSKRGDHRISEPEFLDWISHFIHVSADSQTTTSGSTKSDQAIKTSETLRSAKFGRRAGSSYHQQQVVGESGRISRSSAAGSSLIAQPAAPLDVSSRRRGSGSGLALMRSLSSSAASSGAQSGGSVASSSASGSAPSISNPRAGSSQASSRLKAQEKPEAEFARDANLEAIHDLKAAFCVFDLDADGYITIDEVQAGLKLLGESWSPNELRQVLSRCSSSSSSSLSPSSKPSQDLSRSSKRQQDLQQRISIDDFVRLLL